MIKKINEQICSVKEHLEIPRKVLDFSNSIFEVLVKLDPELDDNICQNAYPVLHHFQFINNLSSTMKASLAYRIILFTTFKNEKSQIPCEIPYALAAYCLVKSEEEESKKVIDLMVKDDLCNVEYYEQLFTSLNGNPIGMKMINIMKHNISLDIPNYEKKKNISNELDRLMTWHNELMRLKCAADKLEKEGEPSLALAELNEIIKKMRKDALDENFKDFTALCYTYKVTLEKYLTGVHVTPRLDAFLRKLGKSLSNDIIEFEKKQPDDKDLCNKILKITKMNLFEE